MKSLKKTYSQLKDLKKRNVELKDEIKSYEDQEEFKRRNTLCDKEFYGILYFKRLPLSYINTVFYTYAYWLYPKVNTTFEEYILGITIEHLKALDQESIKLTFAMLCVGVKASIQGPILILNEPYKTLRTKPLRNTTLKTAKSWVNRILLVDLTITKTAFDDVEFKAHRIRPLKLTRYGELVDGVEKPFSHGDNITQFSFYGSESHCFKNDKRILESYGHASGKEACMNALDELESFYAKQCIIPPYRENKNTLWIRLEYESIGVFYNGNHLELIYQPKSNILERFNADGSANSWTIIFDRLFASNTDYVKGSDYFVKLKNDECQILHYTFTDLINTVRIRK